MSEPRIIEKEQVDRCQLCGAIAETRPYGPNGEEVCFTCMKKDEESARKQFAKHVFGNGVTRHRVRGKKGRTK
jgi:hypothetical protein